MFCRQNFRSKVLWLVCCPRFFFSSLHSILHTKEARPQLWELQVGISFNSLCSMGCIGVVSAKCLHCHFQRATLCLSNTPGGLGPSMRPLGQQLMKIDKMGVFPCRHPIWTNSLFQWCIVLFSFFLFHSFQPWAYFLTSILFGVLSCIVLMNSGVEISLIF